MQVGDGGGAFVAAMEQDPTRDVWAVYQMEFAVNGGHGEIRHFVGSTRVRITESVWAAVMRRQGELLMHPPSTFFRSSVMSNERDCEGRDEVWVTAGRA